jgi:hypothetical protein
MKKDVIAILKAKGLDTPEQVIEELVNTGVLTGFDMSKYLARHEFLKLSFGVPAPTQILKDVAHKHNLGHSTLKRMLSV